MPPRLHVPRLPLAVRRQLVLRRRLLAALVAGLAVMATARTLAPPAPPTVAVTVAARDLPAGTVLDERDLDTQRLPEDLAPPPPGDLPGRVLAAPVRGGEAIDPLRLVGPDLATAGTGETVLAVRLPDPGMAALLAAGDELDLLATDPASGTSRVLAHDVRVVSVPDGLPPGPAGEGSGALVVVAVPAADALEVTGASLTTFLSIAW